MSALLAQLVEHGWAAALRAGAAVGWRPGSLTPLAHASWRPPPPPPPARPVLQQAFHQVPGRRGGVGDTGRGEPRRAACRGLGNVVLALPARRATGGSASGTLLRCSAHVHACPLDPCALCPAPLQERLQWKDGPAAPRRKGKGKKAGGFGARAAPSAAQPAAAVERAPRRERTQHAPAQPRRTRGAAEKEEEQQQQQEGGSGGATLAAAAQQEQASAPAAEAGVQEAAALQQEQAHAAAAEAAAASGEAAEAQEQQAQGVGEHHPTAEATAGMEVEVAPVPAPQQEPAASTLPPALEQQQQDVQAIDADEAAEAQRTPKDEAYASPTPRSTGSKGRRKGGATPRHAPTSRPEGQLLGCGRCRYATYGCSDCRKRAAKQLVRARRGSWVWSGAAAMRRALASVLGC